MSGRGDGPPEPGDAQGHRVDGDGSMRAAEAAGQMVEVVDASGRVVRTVPRHEMRSGRLRHRCVFVAVIGSDGRLLVHRRADWKDTAPGWWDVALGGVVGTGEAWDDAARRELAEEAGVAGVTLERLGAGEYADGVVDELAEVYLARTDGPFAFADGEVVEVAWVARAALDAWLAERPVCPDSVALVLPRLPW
ncbi:MAG: NUDIX domain-containing protein [Actinobacteria bacterium]|nr:NUDIX domain-containing protein [Actinomycetota bacterium]